MLARAPGRVNLIGDHTDYNEGVALAMALDMATEVRFVPGPSRFVVLDSSAETGPARVSIDVPLDDVLLRSVRPPWARYVAGVVAAVRPRRGGTGSVSSELPIGAGLASSASLEISLALAFGWTGDPLELARACQSAELAATGVPCGLLDQVSIIDAAKGHATLIDFADLSRTRVPLPVSVDVLVVDSGERRSLDDTAYAERRSECEAAARSLGPLGRSKPGSERALSDPVLRRRVRHVVSECERVRRFARAVVCGDVEEAGTLMTASHASLARDFEVSTPGLDALVGELTATEGVLGARLTGGGFGGCVVALSRPGAVDPTKLGRPCWLVRPADGASRSELV